VAQKSKTQRRKMAVLCISVQGDFKKAQKGLEAKSLAWPIRLLD
jgi:hypothetical protein